MEGRKEGKECIKGGRKDTKERMQDGNGRMEGSW
jgi:hypothetical protein